MIRWDAKSVEKIIGAEFALLDHQEKPFEFREANFEVGALKYCLSICPVTEHVWLRADSQKPDQAVPAFEFSFRCDRIRTGSGGYNSEAVYFDFSGGCSTISTKHYRLVLDRLPSGSLYIWPIIGSSDAPLEDSTQ
ncbi:MAG: hypothetical protein ACI8UO_002425 [Verrucomicrobiales bacterium]|jgi:hypothetical protein